MSLRRADSDMSGVDSPRSGPVKAVTIQDEPEHIQPMSSSDYVDGEYSSSGNVGPRLHRASISGKKMTGRPEMSQNASASSLTHSISQMSLPGTGDVSDTGESKADDPQHLLAQVVSWLHEEKAKRSRRKRSTPQLKADDDENAKGLPAESPVESKKADADLDLGKLETILSSIISSGKPATPRLGARTSGYGSRKGTLVKKLRRGSIVPGSSDTEYRDGDLLVPNVEATLDNSKTMAYGGGGAESEGNSLLKKKDKENWVSFKKEIVRLTHTLRLKGWRRVPIESGNEIHVERLSGALTNAVYVVSPPKTLPELDPSQGAGPLMSKSKPKKLLLRIYGPQVEHLIDREVELAILRRLARKKIGPRMLGTFHNGRFEEFFHARTLTAEDLRVPDTSKQIAKRMRELHDGIELLQSEFEAGPRVFINWKEWVDRCERVVTFLDQKVKEREAKGSHTPDRLSKYTKTGLVCGVEWPLFRKTVERYHAHLISLAGGRRSLRESLVFAHNDTQYGNLMRLEPEGESPLLQAANEHKQLVVIDFEYASANTPGLEFANHFSEWCYNYHHPEWSWRCNTSAYPRPEEQYRFVRSYVMHRPQFHAAASATPKMDGREKTNIPDFMLDARASPARQPGEPPSYFPDYQAEEKARQERMEADIQKLLRETRLWRTANSAQWVTWGIVQAKIPELDEPAKGTRARAVGTMVNASQGTPHAQSDPIQPEVEQLKEDARHDRPESRTQEEAHEEGEGEDGEHEDEFDYLAYAHDRAMFFWGDCLQMGFVKEEELPDGLRRMCKVVEY